MNSPLLLPKDRRTCAVLAPLMPPARLPAHRLSGGSWGTAVLPLRCAMNLHSVKPSDSALRVVTDFTHQEAFTVAEDRLIEDALDEMFRLGVSALLTVRAGRITGLLTSYDIHGTGPPPFIGGRESLHREHTHVCDVRTPWSELPAIAWDTVQQAHVDDLLAVFEATGGTHLLVVESAADGSVLVRGLISRARLQRQLERLI